MIVGRFAPSPTGRLHVGNLRTALVAWLAARAPATTGHNGDNSSTAGGSTTGNRFLLRFEDLDHGSVRDEHYRTQADDLLVIGLDWDEPVIRQSERLPRYQAALDRLADADMTYPCFCSRKEIREAASAPNLPHAGHQYPGTCRELSSSQRAERALTRNPAYRIRGGGAVRAFDDLIMGPQQFTVDDFVVRRNDGTPAYHLVVVVDDAAQDVNQVIRADDLLESTSRHLLLYELLDLPAPDHGHVPLVLAQNGDRLAKRHGAVNLDDRLALGESPAVVLRFLASTLDLCRPDETVAGAPGVEGAPIGPADLLNRFRFDSLPHQPLFLPEDYLASA